jgi:hypothetical protein
MIVILIQEQERWLKILTLVKLLRMQLSARIKQRFRYLDLISEQNGTNLDKKHEYPVKTRLVLITGSILKTWIQLVLTRMRDNVPWFSMYTLDIYFTLLAAQAISKAVACTSSYLACTLSYLKTVLSRPRHF